MAVSINKSSERKVAWNRQRSMMAESNRQQEDHPHHPHPAATLDHEDQGQQQTKEDHPHHPHPAATLDLDDQRQQQTLHG